MFWCLSPPSYPTLVQAQISWLYYLGNCFSVPALRRKNPSHPSRMQIMSKCPYANEMSFKRLLWDIDSDP